MQELGNRFMRFYPIAVVLIGACGGSSGKMKPPDGHALSSIFPIVDEWWCVSGERSLGADTPGEADDRIVGYDTCEPSKEECLKYQAGLGAHDGGALDVACHAPQAVYVVTFLGSAGSEVFVVKTTKDECEKHRAEVKLWDAKQISPCTEVARR